MGYLGFAITGVSPAVGAAAGNTNVTISGSHFTANTTVNLVPQSGTVISPAPLSFENSNTLLAILNLAGVAPGFYNVRIEDSGQTFTDPLAFQVVPAVASLSGTISSNTELLGGVVYQVTGNVEVASGETLTIDPGAILKFGADGSLMIDQGAALPPWEPSSNRSSSHRSTTTPTAAIPTATAMRRSPPPAIGVKSR